MMEWLGGVGKQIIYCVIGETRVCLNASFQKSISLGNRGFQPSLESLLRSYNLLCVWAWSDLVIVHELLWPLQYNKCSKLALVLIPALSLVLALVLRWRYRCEDSYTCWQQQRFVWRYRGLQCVLSFLRGYNFSRTVASGKSNVRT